MLSQIKSMAKTPAFWVVLVVVAVALTAYSKLRGPFKGIAGNMPKADLQ